ncbi:translation initiation factor IF-2 [Candidatus Gottesmanbacteria bacterium]|nr:translation initiation factor IF-2 [Candidatus Gottesmanbacteria bacterium]
MANRISKKRSVSPTRCPIVTILGHVDHGKTTLLDTIRKTNLAAKEYGGITQHIGAYQIKSPKGKITFIDTPGHEAFAKMRSRGAEVADVVVLVIAGNDGVMPQTIESINYIRKAKIPTIIAINKIDLPDVNIDKIKKQLIKQKLQLEEFGGDIPVIPLSAKSGQGVDKLIEMILLVAELFQAKKTQQDILKGIVIESSLSANRGPLATIVVKSGNLCLQDEIVCENQEFRVRALTDFLKQNLTLASTGDVIEVIGWKTVPIVGSILYKKLQLQLSLSNKTKLSQIDKRLPMHIPTTQVSLETEKLKIIIKADTNGTLEAIINNLPGQAIVITCGIGSITESDILFAKTTGAIVIGFNTKISSTIAKLAESEKVIVKTYNIIYELIQEIDDVINAKTKISVEKVLGEAKILTIFHIRNLKIAGIKVTNSRIAKGDLIKIIREEKEIGRARIKSLRHGKVDITTASQGMEAGLILASNIEFLTGDSIISIG